MIADFIEVIPNKYESITLAYSYGYISYETMKELITNLKEKQNAD